MMATANAGRPPTLAAAFLAFVHQRKEASLCFSRLGQPDHSLTVAAALDLVRSKASLLDGLGVTAGSAVALAVSDPFDFFHWFWAIQWCGCVAVPLADPMGSSEGKRNLLAAVNIARAQAIVIDISQSATDFGVPTLHPAACGDGPGREFPVSVDPDTICTIQFSSGSTGFPKGCLLRHRAVLDNAAAIIRETGAEPGHRAVCWLPLNHDMGLMSGIVCPVVGQTDLHLLPTKAFILSPVSWLRALSGTVPVHTAAPCFALELVRRRIGAAPPADLNLSAVQTIMCGAEPIFAATVERFYAAFSGSQLSATSFHAAYGMAEAVVMITSAPGGLRSLSKTRFETGDKDDSPEARIVNVGRPIAGIELAIDEERSVTAAFQVGEILLRGDSLTSGYVTTDGFRPALDHHGWFHTGDLGALDANGELYIFGRIGDVIKVQGRKLFLNELREDVANELGLDQTRVNATAASDGARADVLVVLECRGDEALLIARVQALVVARFGVRPQVVILSPGTLPRTSSGKVRRASIAEFSSSQSDGTK